VTNQENETKFCPEFEEYMMWVKDDYMPKTAKFYEHMANCSKCQQFILAHKDDIALKVLTSSPGQFIEMVKKSMFG